MKRALSSPEWAEATWRCPVLGGVDFCTELTQWVIKKYMKLSKRNGAFRTRQK